MRSQGKQWAVALTRIDANSGKCLFSGIETMKITSAIILALGSVWICWRILYPTVDTKAEQDRCIFGALGNEAFQIALSRIQEDIRGSGKAHLESVENINHQIQSDLDRLVPQGMPVEEAILTVHAYMRGQGGFLRFVRPNSFGKFRPGVLGSLDAKEAIGIVYRLGYGVEPLRFGIVSPLILILPIEITLLLKPDVLGGAPSGTQWTVEESRSATLKVSVAHYLNHLIKVGPPPPLTRSTDFACPPIPPKDWLEDGAIEMQRLMNGGR